MPQPRSKTDQTAPAESNVVATSMHHGFDGRLDIDSKSDASLDSAAAPIHNTRRDSRLDVAEQKTFTCFNKLAPELRDSIWTLVSFQPRNLDIWAPIVGTIEGEMIYRYATSTPQPAILQTNKEARTVGLRYYKKEFDVCQEFRNGLIDVYQPACIYLNYISDRVCPMGPYHSWKAEIDILRRFRVDDLYRHMSFAFNLSIDGEADDECSLASPLTCTWLGMPLEGVGPEWPREVLLYRSDDAAAATIDAFRGIEFVDIVHESNFPVQELQMVQDPLALICGLATYKAVCDLYTRTLDSSLQGWAERMEIKFLQDPERGEEDGDLTVFDDYDNEPNLILTSMVVDGTPLDTFSSEDLKKLAKQSLTNWFDDDEEFNF